MKKILIIRLGAIGDVILTSPAALNMKLSFPDSKVFFLTREYVAGLIERFAGVDEVLPLPQRITFRELFRMAEYIEQIGFDMAVDLHGNIRSKYLMRHIAAGIKVQYGKRRFERLAATRLRRIDHNPPHTVDLYNRAVEKCGARAYAGRPVLQLPKKSERALDFGKTLPVIAVAPGASYPTKRWFSERFIALVNEIFERIPANVVLILTDDDRELLNMPGELPDDRLKTLVNADLCSLAEILEESDLLICNDSALGHLGSAVGTPVAALFGPTHPTLGFAPRGMGDSIVQVDEYCRPCSLHGKRACYRDRQYCFERISVDDMLTVISERLESNAKGRKAIFVDRDGTLIKEKNFLDNPDEVEPESGSIEAVRAANRAGYRVIVLSNQSGVARGYFPEHRVHQVNERVRSIFEAAGAGIDDILYCPHHPDGEIAEYARECDCRKPSPGMVEKACQRHNINPFRSFFVGDRLSDINLAHVTGGRAILVRTGYGHSAEENIISDNKTGPERIVDNLLEAVEYIIDMQSQI
ncbi:MAG: HAD-IIIA family hydrolase [Candidatus Zixiibacteriota bacterium]|nr:MAG: HAD-IIIA family hydrolase [candidate division Zixibacteria bacterium]